MMVVKACWDEIDETLQNGLYSSMSFTVSEATKTERREHETIDNRSCWDFLSFLLLGQIPTSS